MTHRSLLHVAYVAPFSSTGVYGVYIYEIGQSLKRATVFLHKDVDKIDFKHPSLLAYLFRVISFPYIYYML